MNTVWNFATVEFAPGTEKNPELRLGVVAMPTDHLNTMGLFWLPKTLAKVVSAPGIPPLMTAEAMLDQTQLELMQTADSMIDEPEDPGLKAMRKLTANRDGPIRWVVRVTCYGSKEGQEVMADLKTRFW